MVEPLEISLAPPEENRALSRLGHILEYLGLAMMIGGMLALGAFVAPLIFHNITLALAGKVMTMIFLGYDHILVAAVVMILLGEVLQIAGHAIHGGRLLRMVRYFLALAVAGLTVFSVFVLHPQIQAYQQAGVTRGVGEAGKQFDQLHNLSTSMYKLDLGLAVALLITVTL